MLGMWKRAAGGTVWRIAAVGLALACGCKKTVGTAPAVPRLASTQVVATQVAIDRVELRRQFQQKLIEIAPTIATELPYQKGLLDPETEARFCPLLLQYLLHATPSDRLTATHTLMRLGPYARPAVPALVLALTHPDKEIRRTAADILAYARADPKLVLPALVDATHDLNPSVRKSALTAIYHTGPADADDFDQLIHVNSNSPTEGHWTTLLDPDAGRKILEAAKAIDISRPSDVAMTEVEVAEIHAAMQRPEPVARVEPPPFGSLARTYHDAAQLEWDKGLDRRLTALYRMSTFSSAAVPGLAAAIDGRLYWVRHVRALEYLRELGPIAVYAAPELARSLAESSDCEGQRLAYETLERMGPEAKLAVPILRGGMTEESHDRIFALLCRIEPELRHQDEPLIAQLSSPDYMTRVQAARSLNGAAPPEVLEALVRAVIRRDLLAREGLTAAIQKAHPHPEAVLPALEELAQSKDGGLRARGLAGLREIEREE